MNKISKELKIKDILKLTKCDTLDIIITPNCKVNLYRDVGKTVNELGIKFSDQKEQIECFFKYSAPYKVTQVDRPVHHIEIR